jgi:hypothetical protein
MSRFKTYRSVSTRIKRFRKWMNAKRRMERAVARVMRSANPFWQVHLPVSSDARARRFIRNMNRLRRIDRSV